MIVVKYFHSFSQNTVFSNFDLAKTGNSGSGNIGIITNNHFCIWFYSNKIGLVDGDVSTDKEAGVRRYFYHIIAANTERWMDLTFAGEKEISVFSCNAAIGNFFQLQQNVA